MCHVVEFAQPASASKAGPLADGEVTCREALPQPDGDRRDWNSWPAWEVEG